MRDGLVNTGHRQLLAPLSERLLDDGVAFSYQGERLSSASYFCSLCRDDIRLQPFPCAPSILQCWKRHSPLYSSPGRMSILSLSKTLTRSAHRSPRWK